MLSADVEFPAELERAAMRCDPLPTWLEYPEQVHYLNLRNLYKAYHMGAVTREQAAAEKKQLLDEYRCYKFNRDLERTLVEQVKATEAARAAYRKNRTLENADALIMAIDGVPVKKENSNER